MSTSPENTRRNPESGSAERYIRYSPISSGFSTRQASFRHPPALESGVLTTRSVGGRVLPANTSAGAASVNTSATIVTAGTNLLFFNIKKSTSVGLTQLPIRHESR